MSTRNFMSVNPTGIYVLREKDFLLKVQENIINELKALGIDTREQDCISSDSVRGYGGWLFGMAYGVENGNYEYVTVELLTRNGYYDGLNLDYIVGYLVNGEEYEDEYLSDAYVYSERAQDYIEISKTRVERLRAQARALTKKIAKVYANNTTELRLVGTFSNGEAVYEKKGK